MAFIESQQELNDLRHSCRILISCLKKLRRMVKPGVSAKDLDDFTYQFIHDNGGKPSFLGYDGFKYSLCTSINDEIAHGLSSQNKIIPDFGLVNLDVGVNFNGMFSDSGITILVGQSNPDIERLMKGTQEALLEGIKQVKSGVRVGAIGEAVDNVSKKYKLGNVYELGGHGLGRSVHEEPFIANYGRSDKGAKLFENQIIAIEPLFTLGSGDAYFDSSHNDGWTVRTRDGSWCAQFEHTVLVTKKGYEILTDIPDDQLIT